MTCPWQARPSDEGFHQLVDIGMVVGKLEQGVEALQICLPPVVATGNSQRVFFCELVDFVACRVMIVALAVPLLHFELMTFGCTEPVHKLFH
jgi:hypothetical protein